MLAVLTYLSIEPKKETLQIKFFFSFYKFELFLQYNSQVIYFGEIIFYFCININYKYSTWQLAATSKFSFKNATKELSDLKIILSF